MNVYKLINHGQLSCFRARHHGKRYYINSVHNPSSVTRGIMYGRGYVKVLYIGSRNMVVRLTNSFPN